MSVQNANVMQFDVLAINWRKKKSVKCFYSQLKYGKKTKNNLYSIFSEQLVYCKLA